MEKSFNKVYCSDCAYMQADKIEAKCFEKNADNDCTDYKRKWWKFWKNKTTPEKRNNFATYNTEKNFLIDENMGLYPKSRREIIIYARKLYELIGEIRDIIDAEINFMFNEYQSRIIAQKALIDGECFFKIRKGHMFFIDPIFVVTDYDRNNNKTKFYFHDSASEFDKMIILGRENYDKYNAELNNCSSESDKEKLRKNFDLRKYGVNWMLIKRNFCDTRGTSVFLPFFQELLFLINLSCKSPSPFLNEKFKRITSSIKKAIRNEGLNIKNNIKIIYKK